MDGPQHSCGPMFFPLGCAGAWRTCMSHTPGYSGTAVHHGRYGKDDLDKPLRSASVSQGVRKDGGPVPGGLNIGRAHFFGDSDSVAPRIQRNLRCRHIEYRSGLENRACPDTCRQIAEISCRCSLKRFVVPTDPRPADVHICVLTVRIAGKELRAKPAGVLHHLLE